MTLETIFAQSPSTYLPSGVVVALMVFITWLLAHFHEQVRILFRSLFSFASRHIFIAHQLSMAALSAVSLLLCIALKSWILITDPGARPYDETLLQKLPLTIAALAVLFPTAMLLIRVTLPGVYRYLNYSSKSVNQPDQDFIEITAWQRLCIALFFLCFIVYCGVTLFTGSL